MSSSLSGLIKLLIGAIGLTPTLVGLLAAGIMIGKAKPCEGAAPCRPVAYGAEVLLIPIGTAVPFVCGYLLFLVPTGSKKQKQSSASILPSGVTTDV
jgi:hypothetical protein